VRNGRIGNGELDRVTTAFNGNVDALRLFVTNNFPKDIADEYWGVASKLVALGNYDEYGAEYVRAKMDQMELAELMELTDEEALTYDTKKWLQIRILVEVMLSLGTGGALLQKSTSFQQFQQPGDDKKTDWSKIMFGDEGPNRINPQQMHDRW
jgi:hypothetical protein